MRSIVRPIGVLAGAFAAGCAPGARPCDATTGCASGRVCQAGRCRSPSAAPSADRVSRFVLDPIDSTLVNDRAAENVPREITLGAVAGGGERLYLRYAVAPGIGAIDSAFLVFDPLAGAPPSSEPVSITVSRIDDAWRRDPKRGLMPPARGRAIASARLTFAPAHTLRLDVTTALRDAISERRRELSLVVLADESAGIGATFQSVAAGGTAPRLDVYAHAPAAP